MCAFMNIKLFGKELCRLLQRINNTNNRYAINARKVRKVVGHICMPTKIPGCMVLLNWQIYEVYGNRKPPLSS